MFDLNQAIAQWRRQLIADGIGAAEILDELESHLREEIERQLTSGMTAEQAFHFSVERLGESRQLQREFHRARRRPIPSSARVGLKLGLAVFLAGVLVIGVLPLMGIHFSLAEQGQGIALLFLLAVCVWICKSHPVASSNPINLNAFTVNARQTLEQARTEAGRLHHDFIGTEHSLLGLMEHEVAQRVLRRFQVDPDMVRREVERLVQVGPAQRTGYDLPCTPRLRQALDLAAQEARALACPQVGSEHILLGLLREGTGVAALVLQNLGVKLEDLRREVLVEVQRGGEKA